MSDNGKSLSVWEIELRDKDGEFEFDAWMSRQESMRHLAQLRKDVEILGEVLVERVTTFNELCKVIKPKISQAVRKGGRLVMGWDKIDNVDVTWKAYYCRNCHTTFMVPWKYVDKIKIVKRGQTIASSNVTIGALVARLGCCKRPNPISLIEAVDDDTYNVHMQGKPRSGEYQIWTVPFSLVRNLSEMGDELFTPISEGQIVTLLDPRLIPYLAIAIIIGLVLGWMLG